MPVFFDLNQPYPEHHNRFQVIIAPSNFSGPDSIARFPPCVFDKHSRRTSIPTLITIGVSTVNLPVTFPHFRSGSSALRFGPVVRVRPILGAQNQPEWSFPKTSRKLISRNSHHRALLRFQRYNTYGHSRAQPNKNSTQIHP